MPVYEQMDLSIIIVNWNSQNYLKRCIASVLLWTRDITYEIVVIDNASCDGCAEMLQQSFPEVRFIQSETNCGFAKANNAAYRDSRGSCLLFLNPDTEFIDASVNIMYDYIQKLSNVGAIGCRVLNADRTAQRSCIQAFPTMLNEFLDSELLRALWPEAPLWGNAHLFSGQIEPGEVEAIAGACIMVKRSLFENLGFFSEEYFMYAEDVDLCYKIRQAGYTNYYIPNATVIHFGGGSTEKGRSDFSAVMMRESIWRFVRKTRGKVYGLAYRGTILTVSIGRLTLLTLLLPLHLIREGGEAWRAALRKWTAILTWSLGLRPGGD